MAATVWAGHNGGSSNTPEGAGLEHQPTSGEDCPLSLAATRLGLKVGCGVQDDADAHDVAHANLCAKAHQHCFRTVLRERDCGSRCVEVHL